MKFSYLLKHLPHTAGLCAAVLAAVSLPSCLDVDDDDNENAVQAEKDLVAYLDGRYAGEWKQYYSTNVYYVPLSTVSEEASSPKVGKHFVRISYDMWKMDDYKSWEPSDAQLISTSDSIMSVRGLLLRNYLHGGPELYPYVNALSDFAPVIGEMRPGEKYRVFIAPSTYSEFKDYTRVIDLTLNSMVDWDEEAWAEEENAMFKSYRMSHATLRDADMTSVDFQYPGAAAYYTAMDYASYEVADASRTGTIQYTVHRNGIGDPLSNGGPQHITYSYGYLQRDYNGKAGVSYVEVESVPYRVPYDILKDNKFGRGFDYALSQLKLGDEATVFVPSRLAFDWAGVVQQQGFGSSSLYVVPPFAPLVFHVKIHASADDE